MDLIFGIVGGLVAGWLPPMIGIGFGGLVGSISVISAVPLLLVIRLVRRAT